MSDESPILAGFIQGAQYREQQKQDRIRNAEYHMQQAQTQFNNDLAKQKILQEERQGNALSTHYRNMDAESAKRVELGNKESERKAGATMTRGQLMWNIAQLKDNRAKAEMLSKAYLDQVDKGWMTENQAVGEIQSAFSKMGIDIDSGGKQSGPQFTMPQFAPITGKSLTGGGETLPRPPGTTAGGPFDPNAMTPGAAVAMAASNALTGQRMSVAAKNEADTKSTNLFMTSRDAVFKATARDKNADANQKEKTTDAILAEIKARTLTYGAHAAEAWANVKHLNAETRKLNQEIKESAASNDALDTISKKSGIDLKQYVRNNKTALGQARGEIYKQATEADKQYREIDTKLAKARTDMDAANAAVDAGTAAIAAAKKAHPDPLQAGQELSVMMPKVGGVSGVVSMSVAESALQSAKVHAGAENDRYAGLYRNRVEAADVLDVAKDRKTRIDNAMVKSGVVQYTTPDGKPISLNSRGSGGSADARGTGDVRAIPAPKGSVYEQGRASYDKWLKSHPGAGEPARPSGQTTQPRRPAPVKPKPNSQKAVRRYKDPELGEITIRQH